MKFRRFTSILLLLVLTFIAVGCDDSKNMTDENAMYTALQTLMDDPKSLSTPEWEDW